MSDKKTGVVPALQSELTGKQAIWAADFKDIPAPAGETRNEIYYRSECHPLKYLHPLYRKMVVGHAFERCGSDRETPSFREWLDLRDRARKDLYWLGKYCIGTAESGSGFVEHVHREQLSMFVQKNFDGVYHKGYTLDRVRKAIGAHIRLDTNGNPTREMLLLAPTGSFKSTGNKIDSAQWIINVPDIRIFIITGSGALAKKFLREVKGFFYKPAGTPYTYFQALFPEFVIETDHGDSLAPMITPARVHAQPGTPTIWVNSIDGVIAGWHCDVWKADDVVNEDNSNTEETREGLKQRYDNLVANRPDEWAFRDQLGTRYHENDWYGTRLKEARDFPDTNGIAYLCRSAWTVLPEYRTVPLKRLQIHMVDLYFPEFMGFNTLMRKARQNEKNFRCQQLNEPAGGDVTCHFTEDAIKQNTIILNAVPRPKTGTRRPYVIWDTAHENKGQSDYSAGAVGWPDAEDRTLYVLEVDYGKWRDSETAQHVVDLHWKWDAVVTEIEKFHGWELFAAEVQRISLQKYGKRLPLAWRDADPASGGKRNRVKGLEILLNTGRLRFVEGDWMEQTTRQFTQFTGVAKKRKDDIPDAIAGLQKFMPREVLPADLENSETDEERREREKNELVARFQQAHADAEYQTIFSAPLPPPEPVQEERQARRVPEGPGSIFGNTGIHL